jgi:glycosyltransferase involved in cell wall biosynthesis
MIKIELNKKKILVFIGGSYVSGLEIATLHLIIGLKATGNDVRCLISGWNDGVFKQKLDDAGIPWYEVKLGWIYLRKPLWTLDTLVHLPGGYFACKKILQSFDPDICHFCNYGTAIILNQLLKGRNCLYNLQEPHQRTQKHLRVYRLLNKRIKIFTTVSRRIVKILEDLEIPAEKIRLIYNGVPPVENISAKTISDRGIVFAIIGQIVPWKGHDTLVDAVEQLAGSGPQFVVYIFGNDKNEYAGKLRSKIEAKGLAGYFEWKGFVKEQADIYKQVDVVIVPSLSEEPCSLSILESMMRKKGLIVSDRGGNPELVSHNDSGLVFAAEDPAALAGSMRQFLQEPVLIAKMGNRAGERALVDFTETRMTDEYLRVYEDMTALPPLSTSTADASSIQKNTTGRGYPLH